MRKIIYIFVLLMSVSVWTQQNEVPLSGNFGGTRCNGSVGLCNIGQNPTGKEQPKLSAKKYNGNSFQLIIYRNQISPEEELKIVGQPISSLNSSNPPNFIIEEDFLLDDKTIYAIGLSSGYIIIPAGEYPMSFDSQKIYIDFTLEKP